MTQHNLTTERVDITLLRPHPLNPRNGDVDMIAESLHTNGQYRPIVVAADGTILAGNHTYAAAMSLGWPTLDIVRLDLDPTSPEAYRIMVADNRTADLGRYDEPQLLSLIRDLNAEVGLEGTGYDEGELDRLERLVAAINAGGLNVDDEWVGMPDFEQEQIKSAFKTTVHFQTEEDADEFFGMIGRDKRAWVFWPKPWDTVPQRFHSSRDGALVVPEEE